MEKKYTQISSLLAERGYQPHEIRLFISILTGLEDVFEWRKAGRWTAESRRKHGEMSREYFKRNRDAAEFVVSPLGFPALEQTITGWDNIVKRLGLKETTLRTMFSISQDKNIIHRNILINQQYYRAKIEYRGIKNDSY